MARQVRSSSSTPSVATASSSRTTADATCSCTSPRSSAPGLKSLNEGQRITFDVEPDKKGKGPKAVNLVITG